MNCMNPNRPTSEGRYTRSIYAPSSVLILIFSPVLTKGGTWTMRPVSVFAGLKEVVTVAFLISGSVSVTVSTTEGGSSTPIGLARLRTRPGSTNGGDSDIDAETAGLYPVVTRVRSP